MSKRRKKQTRTCTWICGLHYDTECGHTYFPFDKWFPQPTIKDDICPWCGGTIVLEDEDEGYEDEDDY